MTTTAVNLCALLLYLVTATVAGVRLARGSSNGFLHKARGLLPGFLALAVHAISLYGTIVTDTGLNLSVTHSASLVAWLIAFFVLITCLSRPLENLAVVLLPMAALAIGLDMLFPGRRLVPESTPVGIEIHVVLSILAYSALSVAAVQAMLLSAEDYLLRTRKHVAIMQYLPPLYTLETMMFQVIGVGFFLLSLGLISGFMFVDNMAAQHLAHKTILSVLAWFVFATLLAGRYRNGWRGRKAVRYTLGGFATLMLAFFGSKIVLELILHRV